MNQLAARLLAMLPACILLAATASRPAAADETDAAMACPEPALAPIVQEAPNRENAPVIVEAQRFDASRAGRGIATGHVELFRADQYLSTERLEYSPASRTVTAPVPLIYRDAQVGIEASRAEYRIDEDSGEFHDIVFHLQGSTANGAAERLEIVQGNRSHLYDIRFTTCPGEEPGWMLSARELELRHDEGMGVARNAQLRLGQVPVLWAPWFTFPIDDRRKSGFLYPSVGSANDLGIEVSVPWYWNIAPNQDATLVPRYFSDRGFMLTTEYRLLTPRTRSELNFDFLPDDKETGDNRYRWDLRSGLAINPRWRGALDFERVSDDEYYQDFGGNLEQTSRQFLRSNAQLDGAGRWWIFSIMADDFQVIDDSVSAQREPYRRVPRVGFMLDAPLGRQGLQVGLDSEAVYFDRSTGVTGGRLDLYPQLAWDLHRHWGFLRASAGYRYTTWTLDNRQPGLDDTPSRGTEILSLDAGMYFERTLGSGDVQTLEPRVYYLYVPFENQDDLPDFDTGEFTFGFAQLFHYNRFTGADRQTDANQITLAATTRSIKDGGGREVWNLSLGQILYFTSPRVMLDDEPTRELDSSPFLAEFEWRPLDRFFTRLGIQWDWEQDVLDVAAAGFDWRTKSGHRLAFDYRFRRDRLDQFDIRYYWPINDRWKAFTRVNYSLEDSDLLEALAGIEYESCCWALRVVARRYLKDRQGGERDAIYLELRLKGLASIGRREAPLFGDGDY